MCSLSVHETNPNNDDNMYSKGEVSLVLKSLFVFILIFII